MGFIAAAAITAVGAGVSAYGASQNSKAQSKSAKKAGRAQEALYQRWDTQLKQLTREKEDILFNAGDIFERYESTGAFGDDPEISENLRTAQKDFSRLAAGDFSGFESQLRKSMNDALVNTVGRGSPVGAYSQLAADTVMNYRQAGIQTATGLTDFFASQTQNLLATEFGIMDQAFEVGYQLDSNRVTGKNEANMMAARQEGVSTMALGQAGQTVGGAWASAYGGMQAQSNLGASRLDQYASMNSIPKAVPVTRSSYYQPSPSSPRMPSPVNYSPPVFDDWVEPAFNPVDWNSNPGVLPGTYGSKQPVTFNPSSINGVSTGAMIAAGMNVMRS